MGDHMSTKELVDAAVEHLHTRAGVKTVYGEPVVVDGKTIIPVAKVAYGFDAGWGPKRAGRGGAGRGGPARKGEGGGGGVAARPRGVVRVPAGRTKSVPFVKTKNWPLARVFGSASA